MANSPRAALAPIAAMLGARSVAVIGASNDMEYGGRVLLNLRQAGYTGQVHPVNPRHAEIHGLKAYADVRDIPGTVDLAVIVVPARVMPEVIVACGEKGIKAAAIISAGFAERGPEGLERQNEIVRLARRYGMRLSGPNSLGVANFHDRLFAAAPNCEWDAMRVVPGAISMVSQSGALAFTTTFARALERGIGFRHMISVGNQADLTVVDFIEYLVEADDATRVIAVFLEGLPAGEGRRFLAVARRAARVGKPILVLKIGKSEQGEEAARSHTAALIGRDAVYEGAFRQGAVVRVTDLDDLWEAGHLFAAVPELRGDGGVGVASNSGGMNSVFVDACGDLGVPVPAILPETFSGIEKILAGRGSSGNPVDASGQLTKASLQDILRFLERDPAISIVVLAATTLASGKRSLDIARNLLAAHERAELPHVMLWASSPHLHGAPTAEMSGVMQIRTAGIPVFHEPAKCARALRWLRDYSLRRRGIAATEDAVAVDLPRPSASQPADHLLALGVLSAAGVPVARTEAVADLAGALAAAARIGYPVVLKIDAPNLLHKTEVRGVEVGITDAPMLERVYRDLWERTASLGANRRVLVQEQVERGIEFILGGMHDAVFGPVVMVGTGGVWVEIAEDVAFRVAPVDHAVARGMLDELRGSRLLAGLRGAPPGDAAALVDAIVRFSRLLASYGEELAECEVNPILVLPEGRGVKAVDVLMLPGRSSAA